MSHNKIVIEIVDKVATCLTKKAIVCGNSKYVADFVFDEEWNEHEVKTAVFKVNGECFREVFTGTSCKIPAVQNTVAVTIGVFAGTIDDGTLSTTTPAMVRCKPCITDGESIPMPPQDDVYNQIVGLCEEAVSTAKSVEERADNGEFDGEKGDPGTIDQETLNDINNSIAKKLDKGTTTGGMSAYTVMGTTQSLTKVEYDTVGSSIARRTSSGQLKANNPKEDKDLTTKKYVDDAIREVEQVANDAFEHASTALTNSDQNQERIVALESQLGDIEAALDAIIEMQDNLRGA